MTAFGQWLTKFIEEKGVDLSALVTAKDGKQTQAGNVIQSMMSAQPAEQIAIRNAFVVIDYSDGNILKFIDHLAKAGPAEHFEKIAAEDFGFA
jgi:hypothetical protein